MSEIDRAIELLKEGNIVAIPTETVYGLAACIDQPAAIKKIFEVKERPFFDPLIIHVHSIEQAKTLFADWGPIHETLAQKFWPGPLTLVSKKNLYISDIITSGLDTVGIRWPRHKVAQELLEKLGVPVAAPSANKFGQTSPSKAEHVRTEFTNSVFVLDGGDCEVGIESTIVFIQHQEVSILRPGMVSKPQINEALSSKKIEHRWVEIQKAIAPGQMKHHYMPAIPLVICQNAQMKLSELAEILKLKIHELPDQIDGVIMKKPQKIKNLGFLKLPLDAKLGARALYGELRKIGESQQFDAIVFLEGPQHRTEEWSPVMDRLKKAASLVV